MLKCIQHDVYKSNNAVLLFFNLSTILLFNFLLLKNANGQEMNRESYQTQTCEEPCQILRRYIFCEKSNLEPQEVIARAGRCLKDNPRIMSVNLTFPDGIRLTDEMLVPLRNVESLSFVNKTNIQEIKGNSLSHLNRLKVLELESSAVKYDQLIGSVNQVNGNILKLVNTDRNGRCTCDYISLRSTLSDKNIKNAADGSICVGISEEAMKLYCDFYKNFLEVKTYSFGAVTIAVAFQIVLVLLMIIFGFVAYSKPFETVDKAYCNEEYMQCVWEEYEDLLRIKDVMDPCCKGNIFKKASADGLKGDDEGSENLSEMAFDFLSFPKEDPLAYTSFVSPYRMGEYRSALPGQLTVATAGSLHADQKFKFISPSAEVVLSPSKCGGTEVFIRQKLGPNREFDYNPGFLGNMDDINENEIHDDAYDNIASDDDGGGGGGAPAGGPKTITMGFNRRTDTVPTGAMRQRSGGGGGNDDDNDYKVFDNETGTDKFRSTPQFSKKRHSESGKKSMSRKSSLKSEAANNDNFDYEHDTNMSRKHSTPKLGTQSRGMSRSAGNGGGRNFTEEDFLDTSLRMTEKNYRSGGGAISASLRQREEEDDDGKEEENDSEEEDKTKMEVNKKKEDSNGRRRRRSLDGAKNLTTKRKTLTEKELKDMDKKRAEKMNRKDEEADDGKKKDKDRKKKKKDCDNGACAINNATGADCKGGDKDIGGDTNNKSRSKRRHSTKSNNKTATINMDFIQQARDLINYDDLVTQRKEEVEKKKEQEKQKQQVDNKQEEEDEGQEEQEQRRHRKTSAASSTNKYRSRNNKSNNLNDNYNNTKNEER